MYIYAGHEHFGAFSRRVDADSHRHEMIQISISLQTPFSVSIDAQKFTCKGIIIASGTAHQFSAMQGNQCFFLIDKSSVIATQLADKYLRDSKFFELHEDQIVALQAIANKYYPIDNSLSYRRFFCEILKTLSIDIFMKSDVDARVKKVVEALKTCRRTDHSIANLAQICHLSQSRLSHLFKQETGIRLSSYIVIHKIEKTMRSIFLGKSITEAALDAGFDSPSHFATVCKKMMGMTARDLSKDSVFLEVSAY